MLQDVFHIASCATCWAQEAITPSSLGIPFYLSKFEVAAVLLLLAAGQAFLGQPETTASKRPWADLSVVGSLVLHLTWSRAADTLDPGVARASSYTSAAMLKGFVATEGWLDSKFNGVHSAVSAKESVRTCWHINTRRQNVRIAPERICLHNV